MIRAPQSPRDELAAILGGTLIGRDSIEVGENVIWVSVGGVVRVRKHELGKWSDGAESLAAEFRAAVDEAVA